MSTSSAPRRPELCLPLLVKYKISTLRELDERILHGSALKAGGSDTCTARNEPLAVHRQGASVS
jgi:hypothetical protein